MLFAVSKLRLGCLDLGRLVFLILRLFLFLKVVRHWPISTCNDVHVMSGVGFSSMDESDLKGTCCTFLYYDL